MSDKSIWYVVNLHEWKGAKVHSFATQAMANRFAKKEAEATGCTFAVMLGKYWHQGDCGKCDHYKKFDGEKRPR